MKKLFLLTSFCVATMVINAQVSAVDPHAGHNHGTETKPVAQVSNPSVAVATPANDLLSVNESYDFGKIPQGKPVTHNFEVINIGKTSYKLDNVAASCGCTTPEWDKEKVINAGEKSAIKVGFNAAAEGPFTKAITVTYNGNQTKVITIKGEVWKTPAASAPANTGLNEIKN